MAEWVTDAARALAVGPVLDRHEHLRAVVDHAFTDCVRVVDFDLEEDCGAAEIAWRQPPPRGDGRRESEGRTTDAVIHDGGTAIVTQGGPEHFLGAKDVLVERRCAVWVGHDQTGS